MKRFYEEVSTAERDNGWQVTLDGRGIKTQTGNPQVVPSLALARALAAEWDAQGDQIDPKSFLLRDLADYAIDCVAPDPAESLDKLLGYAETDTLCYRADPDDALFQRQQEVWEPLLAAIEEKHGIRLNRISGIMHRAQPPESMAILRQHLAAHDAFSLAGLFMLTSLSASLCIGLNALEAGSGATALWNAASLEEEWQADLWGRDAEAEDHRAQRRDAFLAAYDFTRLS